MSVTQLMTQPVTVQPMGAGAPDDYGNTAPAPQGDPVPEFGYLDQKDTVEYLGDRDTVVSKWKAFLRPDSVVTALSYVTFAGQTFQVDGEPYHVFNPRTRMVSHIECTLVTVT